MDIITSVLTTLLGVIAGAYLTYRFGLKAHIEASEHKKRIEICSRLMGLKNITPQLYLSYRETVINLYYSKAQWKITFLQHAKLRMQESKELHQELLRDTKQLMQESKDLLLELVKNNQSLFETIGLIQTLFPVTPELNKLINRIHNFKSPNIPDPTDGMNLSQLNSWRTKVDKDIQKFIKDEYTKPINDMLDYTNKFVQKHKVR